MFKMTEDKTENVAKGNFTPADAFINLSFPSGTESGKTALGNKGRGIPLTVDKTVEKQIVDMHDRFIAAGQTTADFNVWLGENLIPEYRPNRKGGGASIDESRITVPAFLQTAAPIAAPAG